MNDTSFDFRKPDAAPAPAKAKEPISLEGGSATTLVLHPLVVINISDHHTRAKANAGGAAQRVFGVLLGEQEGRRVDLANSFEIKFGGQGLADDALDHTYLRTRLEQYQKTFPTLDMIGWYSTADDVLPGDLELHQQLCETYSESLLYLVLDAAAATTGAGASNELPITIFESEVHVVHDAPTMTFAKVAYKIDSIESERIAVDHVAHILPSGDSNSGSALTQHLGTQYAAIEMLTDRIDVVRKYLTAVNAGDVPPDHELLRQIKSLCARLPALDNPAYQEEFNQEYNNTLLITYLGAITKGTCAINDLIEKYNAAYDKHSRRRGIF